LLRKESTHCAISGGIIVKCPRDIYEYRREDISLFPCLMDVSECVVTQVGFVIPQLPACGNTSEISIIS
jgi:hypothetical protein